MNDETDEIDADDIIIEKLDRLVQLEEDKVNRDKKPVDWKVVKERKAFLDSLDEPERSVYWSALTKEERGQIWQLAKEEKKHVWQLANGTVDLKALVKEVAEDVHGVTRREPRQSYCSWFWMAFFSGILLLTYLISF